MDTTTTHHLALAQLRTKIAVRTAVWSALCAAHELHTLDALQTMAFAYTAEMEACEVELARLEGRVPFPAV